MFYHRIFSNVYFSFFFFFREIKFSYMPSFFLQNDESNENVKKIFSFWYQKEKKGEMKKNGGEIERDGKKGGGFIDSFRQALIIITLTIFFSVSISVTSISTEARIAKSPSYFSFHWSTRVCFSGKEFNLSTNFVIKRMPPSKSFQL